MSYQVKLRNGEKLFKYFLITLLSLMAGVSLYAQALSINKKGVLLIDGSKKWELTKFKIKGFKVEKDSKVYISEGVLSQSADDYDMNIYKNGKLILYFEIRDKFFYRAVLLDKSIPVNIKNGQIFIDDVINKAVFLLGKYEIIHGEDVGVSFVFDKYEDLSFYIECDQFSWELNMERFDSLSKELKKDGLKKCKIKKILFFGDQEHIWK